MISYDILKQFKNLQNQIKKQQEQIDTLDQKIELISKEINNLKFEGCWIFVKNSEQHKHKK